jgi:DNA-directed RNA polymerase specialized sigma24 family protein
MNAPVVIHREPPKLSLVTEDPLLQGLRSRKRSAAAELYRRFRPMLLEVATKRAGESDAEDIVEDAMLIALTALTAKSYPDTIVLLESWLERLVLRGTRDRRNALIETDLRDSDECISDGQVPGEEIFDPRGDQP